MDETRLRRLQFLQRLFGGVARRTDLGLGALSLGDIAVNDHEAAIGHRIAAYLDDASIGPGVLEAQFLADRIEAATQLRLNVGIAELAASGEEADVVGIARLLRQEVVGNVKNPLE